MFVYIYMLVIMCGSEVAMQTIKIWKENLVEYDHKFLNY